MTINKYVTKFFVFIAFLAFAQNAYSEVTEKDVAVVSHVIGLLDSIPKGEVSVAVIKGTKDSEVFGALALSSAEKGGVKLKPSIVSVDGMALSNPKAIFIPAGVSDEVLNSVYNFAKSNKLLTISNSTYCLEKKKCAISFSSYPAVDIRMSSSVSNDTGINFGSTFRMIIKEYQ